MSRRKKVIKIQRTKRTVAQKQEIVSVIETGLANGEFLTRLCDAQGIATQQFRIWKQNLGGEAVTHVADTKVVNLEGQSPPTERELLRTVFQTTGLNPKEKVDIGLKLIGNQQ